MSYIFTGQPNSSTVVTFPTGNSSYTSFSGRLIGTINSVTSGHVYSIHHEFYAYYTSTTVSRLGSQSMTMQNTSYMSTNSPWANNVTVAWNSGNNFPTGANIQRTINTTELGTAASAPSLGTNWHGLQDLNFSYTASRSGDTWIKMQYDTSPVTENGNKWQQHGEATHILTSVVWAYNGSKWAAYVPFVYYNGGWTEAGMFVRSGNVWKECYP